MPIFDPAFSKSSFGFRPGRSAHGAVRQVQGHIRAGYRYGVDLDLEKFFDRVCHDVLMARLARKVTDKRLLKLIGRFLRAGISVEGITHPTREGVPQGGPLSPVLSNIVLDELDKELERRGHRFARYADDAVILVKSHRAGERVMASINRFLKRKLKLKVNRQKSRVVRAEEVDFLGFIFRRGKIRWSERSFERFRGPKCAGSRAAPGGCRCSTACGSWGATSGDGWVTLLVRNTTGRGPRSTGGSATRADVLLEAVVKAAQTDRDAVAARSEPARCDHYGSQ